MTAPTLPTRNPRTGEIDYAMPVVTPAQVQSTAARLRAAQTAWVAAGVDHRVAVMQRWAAALAAERDALVAALVADTGRHAEAVLEFDATLGALQRWCAQAPALLTEEPAARLRFRSLAAVPELAAVLAYVTGGPATGEALVRAVDAVCFTGSVKTGRRVGLAAMEAFIPSFLELGGKDAALVLADADLHRTARSLAWGGMVGAGQSCMSIECVYVDATVAQPFTDLLVQREAALRHNWSDIHQGQIGPIIAAAQVDVVRRHLEQAQAAGARALTGGHVVQHGGGWWCEPTALVDDGAKQSFKLSGLGGSRMGPGSLARFYR